MVKIEGINELRQTLNKYKREVSSAKERNSVLFPGGEEVRKEAAKAPTPKSRKVHYYYPKKGSKRVAIRPGNLRQSMKTYKAKTGDVLVGPKVLRKVVGMEEIGRTRRTASGYYAAMLYKSANNFRQAVMEPAMAKATAKAIAAIEKAYEKFHDKLTR